MQSLRHVDHGDLLVPLPETVTDLTQWPKAGAFPLFPFHNRLTGGVLRLPGGSHRLRANTANGADVMHGPAHRRPWRVTDEGPDFVEMTLAYGADAEWPVDFTATQRVTLTLNGLLLDLRLHNDDAVDMPGGVGWHPYFAPPPDGHVQIRTASSDAQGNNWTDRPVDIDATDHLSDWRDVAIRIGVARLVVSAAGLDHLILHRKPGYLCVEPVSHAIGALDALPNVASETGLRMLRPGESMGARLTLEIAKTSKM